MTRLRIRWRIADRLDRDARYCWADLATWAQFRKPWRELRDARTACEISEHGCYCGKRQP